MVGPVTFDTVCQMLQVCLIGTHSDSESREVSEEEARYGRALIQCIIQTMRTFMLD